MSANLVWQKLSIIFPFTRLHSLLEPNMSYFAAMFWERKWKDGNIQLGMSFQIKVYHTCVESDPKVIGKCHKIKVSQREEQGIFANIINIFVIMHTSYNSRSQLRKNWPVTAFIKH